MKTNVVKWILIVFLFVCGSNGLLAQIVEEDEDFSRKREEFDLILTRDPATGKIPEGAFNKALEESIKLNASRSAPSQLVWTERGPYADVAASGNTRPNNDISSGRIRAVMVDMADATGKTVWTAGVTGGLWKTTDITSAPANWIPINDYLSSLSVTDICQDPTNTNIMYFCTGDFRSTGVFRSTDHGVTWTQLTSTSTLNCQRILCDYQGNIYLATWGGGILRSTKASGGVTWTNITPTGFDNRITDIKLSSHTAAGRLHLVSFSGTYRYTDVPATVTSSSNWTTPADVFAAQNGGYLFNARISCSGNTLYAALNENKLVSGVEKIQRALIYRSTNGGANWTLTTGYPIYTNGEQVFMNTIAINPGNTNECIVGYLDNWKTTDGGKTWKQISIWVGTSGQYVHADQHRTLWYDGGNKLIFACDGGIFYSSDKGTTIRDRNSGLRIRQFYSCAVHPTDPNYYLAGSQDNGVSQFKNPGMNVTREVNGGDGGFVAIDQDNANLQIGSYIFNHYNLTKDGAATWWTVVFADAAHFNKVTGYFINPYDYDNANNTMYASHENGQYLRWIDPFNNGAYTGVTIPGFAGMVSCVKVSDKTAHQVYFGSNQGRIFSVTNANTNTPAATDISDPAMPANAFTRCINTGWTNADNLIACYSNYGVNSVWVRNAGGTWTSIEGNLPDVPVYWCMFWPGDDTRAIIATETGVFESSTFNGVSTVWTRNRTMPFTRVDMLKYNKTTGVLAAATHGRGLYTAHLPFCYGAISITNPITDTYGVEVKSTVRSNTTVTLGSGEYAIFDGGTGISLQPGFKVSVSGNAYFKAYIDGCGNLVPFRMAAVPSALATYMSNENIFGDAGELSTDGDTPLYIRNDNFISEEISVFPNPSNGLCTISTKQIEDGAVLEIFNSLGGTVKKLELHPDSNFQIDLSGEAKGIYFINIRVKDHVIQKMLVLQ